MYYILNNMRSILTHVELYWKCNVVHSQESRNTNLNEQPGVNFYPWMQGDPIDL